MTNKVICADEARKRLKATIRPEFHHYIDWKLAGDFACEIASRLSPSPAPAEGLLPLLHDLEEYFDQRADMLEPTETNSCVPNKELIFRDMIRKVIRSTPVNSEVVAEPDDDCDCCCDCAGLANEPLTDPCSFCGKPQPPTPTTNTREGM